MQTQERIRERRGFVARREREPGPKVVASVQANAPDNSISIPETGEAACIVGNGRGGPQKGDLARAAESFDMK